MRYFKFFIALVLVVSSAWYVSKNQGAYSFLFAWVLNFTMMMAVFIFTDSFKPQFNSSYYGSKQWEMEGAIYKWFGVNIYRKFLVLIGWEKVIRASSPVKKDLDAIKHLEHGTRKSEFGHLVVFFVVLGVNIFVALYYGLLKSAWLFSLNIVLNLYPVFIQRYNRPRLQRVMALRRG